MKLKKNLKSLTLTKETIANLNNAKAGKVLTDACQTFNLGNCETWEFEICLPGDTLTKCLSQCIICQ